VDVAQAARIVAQLPAQRADVEVELFVEPNQFVSQTSAIS
jgi:hypothetical protein